MDARNGENDGSYLEVPRKLQPTRISQSPVWQQKIMKGIPSQLGKGCVCVLGVCSSSVWVKQPDLGVSFIPIATMFFPKDVEKSFCT